MTQIEIIIYSNIRTFIIEMKMNFYYFDTKNIISPQGVGEI